MNISAHPMIFNILFVDVENFVTPFSGSETENVSSWIKSFKDASTLLNLSPLQKIIFEKRLMTGKAKLFLSSESQIHTWQQMKNSLLHEYTSGFNSAQLHEMLSQRTMHSDETLDEYFF